MVEDLNAVVVIGLKEDGSRIYKTIGRLSYKNKDPNKPFLLLDRSFNPAGCYHEDIRRTSIIINFYPIGDNNERKSTKAKYTTRTYHEDDDIPF